MLAPGNGAGIHWRNGEPYFTADRWYDVACELETDIQRLARLRLLRAMSAAECSTSARRLRLLEEPLLPVPGLFPATDNP